MTPAVRAGIVRLAPALTVLAALALVPGQRGDLVEHLSGEHSMGTWLSDALLLASATICLLRWRREGSFLWSGGSLFFFGLALDERFQFHEALKTRAAFFLWDHQLPMLWSEGPVLAASLAGAGVAWRMWLAFPRGARRSLVLGATCGLASVGLDVFHGGAHPEDAFKLLGELLVLDGLIAASREQG